MKRFIFILILCFEGLRLLAQISINTNGNPPDPSSLLDVQSSNSGILFPRLSTADRNAVPYPVTGLFLYNTSTDHFEYYNGSEWFQLEGSIVSSQTGNLRPGGGISINASVNALPDSSSILDVNDSLRGVQFPLALPDLIENPAEGLIIYNMSTDRFNYYNGNAWKEICIDSTGVIGGIGRQQRLGVSLGENTAFISSSAILEISSNDKGILIPRLNQIAREVLLPATGLMIYNLTNHRIEYFNGYAWIQLNVSQLETPASGEHFALRSQIVWKWSSVVGATGYKWNMTNDLSTAIDLGTDTTKTETSLSCGTQYTRYVWAYDDCGFSNLIVLNKATDSCLVCGHLVTDNRDSKVYNTVLINSKCWMASNLNVGNRIDGTDMPLDNDTIEKYCYSNSEANCNVYGGLYLWDEIMQYDLIEGIQGICPDGFHIPTDLEYAELTSYLGGTGVAGGKLKETGTTHWQSPNVGATNESGFTALPGGRRRTTGPFENIQKRAFIWSSTVKDNNTAWLISLRNDNDDSFRSSDNRLYGHSVRCLMDSLAFNLTPSAPQIVNPPDGSINQPVNTTLSWSCADPENDTLKYDVYFDSTYPPALVSTAQYSSTYNPGSISSLTTYYWKIIAYDGKSDSVSSSIWSFSTISSWTCGSEFIDTSDNQSYSTIQIGSQCWMAENLNKGTMITGGTNPTDNGVVEKYCYADNQSNCELYGGLYTYVEMMQYSTQTCTQGICPLGWRIPTDEEWCTLTKYIDPIVSCSASGWSGTDAGLKMKSTSGWSSGGNGNNFSGFNALPSGYRELSHPNFHDLLSGAYYFSTLVEPTRPWIRYLSSSHADVNRSNPQEACFSVRCLKDAPIPPPTSGVHIPSTVQIIWKWSSVPGATGYKWSATNNFDNASDLGLDTLYMETELTCNTNYNRFVWAYNECGLSGGTVLSQSTLMLPYAPIAGTHNAQLFYIGWTWSLVPGATGYKWSVNNDFEAAIDVGTSTTKTETNLDCNTDYVCYVWAYNDCGHSSPTILTQSTLVITPSPITNAHFPAYTYVSWRWYTVPGATGYKWNATNDYASAIDLGNSTFITEKGLTCNTTYTRYVWAYSPCGESIPTEITQATWTCCAPLTDTRDNQTYATIGIGTQCWMAQNLNIGTMISAPNNPSDNDIIEKYCYTNSYSNCLLYGGLYRWDEMMMYATGSNSNPSGRIGICPTGWHLPSQTEWCQLETYLDPTIDCSEFGNNLYTDAGGKMKEPGTLHWLSPNTGATNESGFTGLPGGAYYHYYDSDPIFGGIHELGRFWSSRDDSDYDNAWMLQLANIMSGIGQWWDNKDSFLSVRCVKD